MGSSNISNKPPESESLTELVKRLGGAGMVPTVDNVYFVDKRDPKNTIYVVSGNASVPKPLLSVFSQNNPKHCIVNKDGKYVMSAYAFFMLLFGPEGTQHSLRAPLHEVVATSESAFKYYVENNITK